MRSTRALFCLFAGVAVGAASLTGAHAAPALRKQVDQRGDFTVIGNTLGWDCSPGVPAPVVGTVSNMCGTSTADTAADMFWRADEPPGGATASLAITPDMARSTAVLSLPAGATVTYARLYWAALHAGPTADQSVTV